MKKKTIKKSDKSRHYVDNKKLYDDLVEYQEMKRKAIEEGKEVPYPPDKITLAVMMIVERFSMYHKFINYPFRDEMVLDGIESCYKYGIDKFDPSKYNNPLNYFTQIAHNAFITRIKDEQLKLVTKYKIQRQNHLLAQLDDNSYNPYLNSETTEMDEYVRKFEERQIEKKKEQKEKADKKKREPKGLEKIMKEKNNG